MKPRLLDLFCCAGGAGMGYYRAGFDVVGVDMNPQPHYPFKFIQADALAYVAQYGWMYEAIHASPPCQLHSKAKRLAGTHAKEHVDLIPQTRFWLRTLGIPYVIENVEGAPLQNFITLCGSQFPQLKVYRHRCFETSFYCMPPKHYPHNDSTPSSGRGVSPKGFISVSGSGGFGIPNGFNYACQAMGIDWVSRKELSQAIPPAYTEYIGKQLMTVVENTAHQRAA